MKEQNEWSFKMANETKTNGLVHDRATKLHINLQHVCCVNVHRCVREKSEANTHNPEVLIFR